MNEVLKLHGAESRDFLQTAIEQNVSAIMSYRSRDKWHIVKVSLAKLGANNFEIEILPSIKPHPMNIRLWQAVVLSFKHEYGKLIFDTKVMSLEPSPNKTCGGIIVLAVPSHFELVQRRSYYRVRVPQGLKVNVELCHHSIANESRRNSSPHYWAGRLIDLSAGGAQVAVDALDQPDFKAGQGITLRFAPMPNERPLKFNALVRAVLPTADQSSVCLGLQITGLESSAEGRIVLQRLCDVVERYYQINQFGIEQKKVSKAAF